METKTADLKIIRSTPYAETGALLAMLKENEDEARNQLSVLSTSELAALYLACEDLKHLINSKTRDSEPRG